MAGVGGPGAARRNERPVFAGALAIAFSGLLAGVTPAVSRRAFALAALGAILLGQDPSLPQVVGVAFILMGVVSVAIPRRAPTPAAG